MTQGEHQADLTPDVFRAAVASAYDAVLITDAALERPGPRIVYVNDAFCRMTGYAAEEVIGHTPRLLQGPATERPVLDQLRADLAAGRTFDGRATNYRKNGTPFHIEWTVAPVEGRSGVTTHFVAIQRDVTHRQRLFAALREQAIADPVTNAFNRRYGESVLDAELARSRCAHASVAIVLLDIDHFKAVNDRYGHQHGDEILRRVADVLSGRLRASDTVCRWGGEEFLIVLSETEAEGARAVADDLRRLIADTPFPGGVSITVSAGVAVYNGDGRRNTLIDAADRALYAAKESGRNAVFCLS